jgi:hypothetical protein
MSRQPKPYFRKQTRSWCFSSGGKQVNLGPDHKAAMARFHELMREKDTLKSSAKTLYDLSQGYLDWCQQNRSIATCKRHLHCLHSFISHVGEKLSVTGLRPHHLSQ